MTDYVAIGNNVIQSITTSSTNVVSISTVVYEPIISAAQGPQGIQGISGSNDLVGLTDVSTQGVVDGALLIYNAQSAFWEASTILDKQALECGQY